jgi:hypothetical protein
MSRRNGSPEDLFWAKVEKADGCWNWTAYTCPLGYGQFRSQGRSVKAHRFSFEMANGPIIGKAEVDHTCHNRACVNPDHLRLTTRKQNCENRRGADSDSISGVRGVNWHSEGKWRAQVKHNQRNIYLGLYPTIAEAEAVVTAKRLELFTHNDADRASTA